MTFEDRFWAKVDKNGPIPAERPELGPCWSWLARLDHGYGRARREDQRYGIAHRVSYEMLVGPVPAGAVLDHLCRNRACVNPAHLRAIRQGEVDKDNVLDLNEAIDVKLKEVIETANLPDKADRETINATLHRIYLDEWA